VVLFGAKTPMILRPDGDGRYLLVGECYLHGFMDGEAVGDWESGRRSKNSFTLR
jgi:hypothetical protein